MDEIEIQPRAWPDIVEFYHALTRDYGWTSEPMVRLVKRIADSGYASGLFPYTSLSTLCLAHTHRPRQFWEELRITFDPVGRQFHFEYWSHSLVRPGPWRRTCHESEGFAVLERCLLKRLRWFKVVGQPPRA